MYHSCGNISGYQWSLLHRMWVSSEIIHLLQITNQKTEPSVEDAQQKNLFDILSIFEKAFLRRVFLFWNGSKRMLEADWFCLRNSVETNQLRESERSKKTPKSPLNEKFLIKRRKKYNNLKKNPVKRLVKLLKAWYTILVLDKRSSNLGNTTWRRN